MFRINQLFAIQEKRLRNSLHLRSFKNFGHKRQPVPLFTILWHGFLTFTFIGSGIEWKRIKRMIFDREEEKVRGFLE